MNDGCLKRAQSFVQWARPLSPHNGFFVDPMQPAEPQAQKIPTPLATAFTPLSDARRERLRFSEFSFTRTPAGVCVAEVELEWAPGTRFRGRSEGQSSPLGDLRIAAEAAMRALESFSKGELAFELIGVKMVRAFDANLIIVSISMRGTPMPTRLLGCYLAEGDIARGAATAVLNATNRVLGNFISVGRATL
jgi:hypothetical protein